MSTRRNMRFLDLDLDFFLNHASRRTESNSERLSSSYKPWSASQVSLFLEQKCGLSIKAPTRGRMLEHHDGVFNFWHTLIEAGSLRIPFELTHVDAHPDLWVGGGLYLRTELLLFDPKIMLAMVSKKRLHPGNYLTFAIAYGWISALAWVTLSRNFKGQPKWDGDARSNLMLFKKSKGNCPGQDAPTLKFPGIPFKILPLSKFRTNETFDYMAVSKSPDFTPPESDKLIPVIEKYMKEI